MAPLSQLAPVLVLQRARRSQLVFHTQPTCPRSALLLLTDFSSRCATWSRTDPSLSSPSRPSSWSSIMSLTLTWCARHNSSCEDICTSSPITAHSVHTDCDRTRSSTSLKRRDTAEETGLPGIRSSRLHLACERQASFALVESFRLELTLSLGSLAATSFPISSCALSLQPARPPTFARPPSLFSFFCLFLFDDFFPPAPSLRLAPSPSFLLCGSSALCTTPT